MKIFFQMVFVGLIIVSLTLSVGATKLVVWQSSGPQEEYVRIMGKAYTEETGIEIQVQPVDQLNQDDKLALDGPSGKGADILAWPHDQLGIPVMQGLLWSLPEEDLNLEPYTDSAVQALRVDGKLYGLPYAMESVALIYNKDIIAEIPDTFADFLEKVTELNIISENRYGFMAKLTDLYFMYGFISGYGGYIFKNTETGFDVNDIGVANEGTLKGMKLIRSFRTSGLMPEGSTYDVAMGLFTGGNLAVTLTGPWEFDNLNKSSINYGIAPLPKLDNGEYPRTFIGVKGYYISAFSEHKREALDFIKWLTNKENNYKQYQGTGIIPARKDILTMPDFQENEDFKAFAIQAGRGEPMPNIPEMAQVWEPMNNAFTFIANGEASAEEIMPAALEQIEENIMMMKK